MSATAEGEGDRDAWLAAALRHAPDAAEAPPPMLRDAILAGARAAALGETAFSPGGESTASPAGETVRRAARAAQRPTWSERAAGWWASLARPPVAAGFATVMVGVLVGVMWHDRPLDEALPAPPPLGGSALPSARIPAPLAAAPEAAVPAPAAVTRPAETAPPTPPSVVEARRPPEPTVDARRRSSIVAPSPEPAMAPQADSATAPAPSAVSRPAPAAEAFPGSTPPLAKQAATGRVAAANATPSPRGPREAAEDREAAHTAARPPLAAPAASPKERWQQPSGGGAQQKAAAPKTDSPEPKTTVMKPQATVSEPNAAMSQPETAITTARRKSESASDLAADKARMETQPQGFRATAPPARVTTSRPMTSLLRGIASADARWTRHGPGGAVAAVDTSFVDWLASVDAAVADNWQPGSPAASRDRRDASVIELRRDNATIATLRIDDDAIVFRDASGREWFAALAPGVAARLREARPPPR